MALLDQAEPQGGVASKPASRPAAAAPGLFGAPMRLAECLVLDSPLATRIYWGSVALVVAGLFATQLLPCVDYPQHLALSDVARRLARPDAPEHALYQLNIFTYNGLFHLTVAALSAVLPIELAGRLVVAASLVAMAAAVLVLVRLLRRPAVHAALFLPILFSFSVGWGFVNYVLATAIAAWALVFVVRAAMRPTAGAMALVATLGFVCAFAHVLAMLTLCLAAAAFALEVAWRASASLSGGRRVLRAGLCTIAALAPLLIGCAYCVAVYHEQYAWDPKMYRDPTIEGSNSPVWEKIVYFGAFGTDLYRDATDQLLLWAAIGWMGWSAMLAFKRRRAWDQPREETPPIVLPFALLLFAYFVTPMVLIGTHLIFPRLSQWAILGAILATPRLLEWRTARLAPRWMLGLALATGVNTVVHCALFGWETRDASRIIDDLPAGGAVTAVSWDPGTATFRNGGLTHWAAYYGARKHGHWAFAFARYLSVPVRFQPNSQPAWPVRGWEFDADEYDARCKYARAFPLVLVKAPAALPRDPGSEPEVRELVFSADVTCNRAAWQNAQRPRLLSHRGQYWAFDTTGMPDDGTF